MTPMVDLGFLLITFFIFTSTLTGAAALKLNIPADGSPTLLPASASLTILAGDNDRIWYYEGPWEEASAYKTILSSDYHIGKGIGAVIRAKKMKMGSRKDDLMLVIKPSEKASFKNIVNLLDEVLINNVRKYSITDPEIEERSFMEQ
jgi:biopolymer transport protein ExbD